MKYSALLLFLLVTAAWAEDPTPPDEEAALKESRRLVMLVKTSGFDAALTTMIDADYFTTINRDADKKNILGMFGEASMTYGCFGGMSNNDPEYVGKLSIDGSYLKVVYLLPFIKAKIPMVLVWSKGVDGFYLNALKIAMVADADMTALLKGEHK